MQTRSSLCSVCLGAAHVGVDGNEDVDILAIQALKLDMVKINVPCAKLKANLLFRIK